MLDQAEFQTHALNAARACRKGAEAEAREHLQRAFDVLLQARSHFYPVDNYLLDITLVVPSIAGEPLRKSLENPAPTSLLLNGQTLRTYRHARPLTLKAIRAHWPKIESRS